MPQHTPIIILTTLLLLITFKSPQLIGFIHGPTSQLLATKQQSIQSHLLSRIISDNHTTTTTTSWMARIQTAAEIYNPHYELAYQQNDNTCILRDAGVFTAMVGVLRACNFFANNDDIIMTTIQQQQQQRRIYQLVMAIALFILPGMIGQLFISKMIPIEMVILWNRFDADDTNVSLLSELLEGMVYVGYCSLKSVLGIGSVVYELKVVGVVLVFVAFVLGDGA